MKKVFAMLFVFTFLFIIGCTATPTEEAPQRSDISSKKDMLSISSEDKNTSIHSEISDEKQDSSETNIANSSNPQSSLIKGKLNYASIKFLSLKHKNSNEIIGQPFKYIAGTSSVSPAYSPPRFGVFDYTNRNIHIVAKAVKEYEGIYETLYEYGDTKTSEYRLFKMEVLDSLESNLEGEFYYILPKHLDDNITKYDSLLIAMEQLPKNFVLKSNGKLTAFEYIFTDPSGRPELGNIIAFSNGVFDESLWYNGKLAQELLDKKSDSLIVWRGSTLKEALTTLARKGNLVEVNHYKYQTDEANSAIKRVAPFINGVFSPRRGYHNVCYRYINGCLTNERINIDVYPTEKVTVSEYQFEDKDFEGLPNIAQYIADINISRITPPHTDTKGKQLIYNSAMGWYEKTKNGVYSIVRIAWRYRDEKDRYTEYYDEAFIILDDTGDRYVSREELIKMIGENQNIYHYQYGVGIIMPMF